MAFHVCCGLAGGTGSGSLIDVIAQIRDTFRGSKHFKILVYALLPDTFPNPTWDKGKYHANGYAALSELNAISVARYKPTDVTGRKLQPLEPIDPFNGCYVFSNENDNGLTVDVDKQLPSVPQPSRPTSKYLPVKKRPRSRSGLTLRMAHTSSPQTHDTLVLTGAPGLQGDSPPSLPSQLFTSPRPSSGHVPDAAEPEAQRRSVGSLPQHLLQPSLRTMSGSCR